MSAIVGTRYVFFMRIVLAVLVLIGAVAVAPGLTASPAHEAVGSWTIEPQSRDANGDGFIDGDGGVPRTGALSTDPSSTYVGAGNRVAQPNERLIDGHLSWYLPRKGYTVNLDACKSKGTSHRWTVRQGGKVVKRTPAASLNKRNCSSQVVLKEGRYTFTLSVTNSGRTKNTSIPGQVRGFTILSLGDSYASGEGNPRNIGAWLGLRNPLSPFTAYWDDVDCRRSTRAAPAQAALAIEKSDPKVPVTFVHLACSGATVNSGVLGPQTGARQTESQIDQARRVLRGQRVDAVLLSIGGNDVGFTSILQACVLNTNCPLRAVTSGPLAGYASIQEGVQGQLAGLGAGYQAIAQALASVAPGAPVFITMYPDITRNSNGAPCTYLTMSQGDFTWARTTILTPTPPAAYPYLTAQGQTVNFPLTNGSLNAQIANTGAIGFTPVTGSWAASGDSPIGHGICAGGESWVIPVNVNGNVNGAFHPNPAGQVAVAQAIEQALRAIPRTALQRAGAPRS
jgi:lysophospholipase L1-like esterase